MKYSEWRPNPDGRTIAQAFRESPTTYYTKLEGGASVPKPESDSTHFYVIDMKRPPRVGELCFMRLPNTHGFTFARYVADGVAIVETEHGIEPVVDDDMEVEFIMVTRLAVRYYNQDAGLEVEIEQAIRWIREVREEEDNV